MSEALLDRLFWWKDAAALPPEEVAAQAMVLGTWDDIRAARERYGEDIFARVLAAPPRGIFDAKSWTFWHKKTGRVPVPPLPDQPAPWPRR
jgi:hypothetical protein